MGSTRPAKADASGGPLVAPPVTRQMGPDGQPGLGTLLVYNKLTLNKEDDPRKSAWARFNQKALKAGQSERRETLWTAASAYAYDHPFQAICPMKSGFAYPAPQIM